MIADLHSAVTVMKMKLSELERAVSDGASYTFKGLTGFMEQNPSLRNVLKGRIGAAEVTAQ